MEPPGDEDMGDKVSRHHGLGAPMVTREPPAGGSQLILIMTFKKD
jgi:hypothetical protein